MQLIRLRHAGVVLAVAIAACNSVAVSGGGFSSSGSGNAVGSGGGATATPPPEPFAMATDCPRDEPFDREACSGEYACDYGNAAELECNERALCTKGEWQRVKASGDCQSCPDDYDERAPGSACTTSVDHPFVCSYYQGTCGCVPEKSDASADASTDAGSDGGSPLVRGTWACVTAQEGCPARRPIAGNACVKSMTCDYGSCLFGTALLFECQGTWSAAEKPQCP